MSRLYLKIALPGFAVFTAVVLLIHAQPYDDHELRAFLTAENCAEPCFLGIRPGVTLGNEAIALLQQNEWIDTESLYIAPDITRNFIWAAWRWSESKPDFLWGTGYLTYSPNGDGTVNFIEVRTTIPAGAIQLALGDPQEDTMIPNERVTAYLSKGLFLQSFAHCGRLWQETVNLYIVAPARFSDVRSQLGLTAYNGALPPRRVLCQSKIG